MISSQPLPFSESVQLSPPHSSSSSPISLALSDSPAPDSTTPYQDPILYTTLPQNCLVVGYGQPPPPTSIDTPSDITTTIKYEYATVISPPHQQHLRSLVFSQPSPPISPSPAFSSPHSCSIVATSPTSHPNHLYKQHQDCRSEPPRQYSAQEHRLNFPGSREQFYERDAADTNNIESPHHNHSNSTRYHLHGELVPGFHDLQPFSIITDINNNDSSINNNSNNSCSNSPGFTEASTIYDYPLDTNRLRFAGGRVSPIDIDRNRGKLPPFSALLSNSAGKSGVLEFSSMMKLQESMHDESDDSGVSSLEEESHYTNLTNVPQTPHDNGNCYDYDTNEASYGDWSMGEPTILKIEPNNPFGLIDYFSNIGEDIFLADNVDDFNDNIDSPTQDSDENESGGADNNPHSYCFPFTNTDICRPGTDVSSRLHYIGHEQFLSSDSEEQALENTLPHFKELQNNTESDNIHMRSPLSCPKKKRRAVRESPSYVEKERRKPGRKPGQVSNVLHLWEFMRDLLHSSENQGIIEWISKPEGVFRVMNSTEVARLWGEKKKNKKKMTYEKLSRSLRYSRLEGYFADLPRDKNYPKKLCFKFGPKSKDWH